MATLDVLSSADAKIELGVKGNAQDARIATYVTAVSKLLDEKCGAVVQRTVTAEVHSGVGARVRLKHPAVGITEVIEYQATSPITLTRETPGTAPGDGYLALRHEPNPTLFSGTLIRRRGGFTFAWWPGIDNVAVTYCAGRYADTASVDERFKTAAVIILRNAWATTEPDVVTTNEFDTPGGRFPRFAIPNAARQLLADEWRATKGIA